MLVVEDDLIIGTDIEYMLHERGIKEVFVASSVSEAERLISSNQIDAAILDYRVRKEVTTEFACRLLRLNVPFIFATGFALNSNIPSELSHIPIVLKPFHPDKMMASLYQAMDLRDHRVAV